MISLQILVLTLVTVNAKIKRTDPALRAVEVCANLAAEYETLDLDECYQYHYERFKEEMRNTQDQGDFDPRKGEIYQYKDLEPWLNSTLSFLANLFELLMPVFSLGKQNETMY
nr:expressed protein [Hymenolepis microstoma]